MKGEQVLGHGCRIVANYTQVTTGNARTIVLSGIGNAGAEESSK